LPHKSVDFDPIPFYDIVAAKYLKPKPGDAPFGGWIDALCADHGNVHARREAVFS